MNERYIKWYTPWLDREFEMLAFGNGGGLPLIIFPTSFGSYYQNKDFGLVGSVAGYVDSGRVTVYCPDAIDLGQGSPRFDLVPSASTKLPADRRGWPTTVAWVRGPVSSREIPSGHKKVAHNSLKPPGHPAVETVGGTFRSRHRSWE